MRCRCGGVRAHVQQFVFCRHIWPPIAGLKQRKKPVSSVFYPNFSRLRRVEYRVCYVFTSLMQNVKVLHFHTSLASVLPSQSTPMTTSTVQCGTEHQEIRNTIDYYTRCFCAQFLSNRLHVSKWKIMLVIIYAKTNCNVTYRRRRFFYISCVFFAFLQPKSTRFKRKKLKI